MRVVCLVLAIAAIVTAPAAFAQSTYKTSTSVFDLQQQLSPITLNSNLIYVSGTGVRLANSATSGVASFAGIDAPFPTNNVVCSWNVDMPAGTGIRTEVRAVNGGTATSWYEIARQGTIPSGISRIKGSRTNGIDDDTLMLPSKYPRIEYRVTLYTNTVGVTPTLRLMAVCYADTSTLIPYSELPPPGYTTSLPVPWRSQYWVPGIGGSICGPTSMSMAEAYNGCNLPTETVAADCYDDYNSIYGNWPFIAEGAAKHGFKTYYSRANDQQPIRDHLANGYPVEIGMAYSSGELTNSPIPSTGGHLVLCVGVTSNGDWICNDPAGSDDRWDHVVYLKAEIANVWGTHNATVIPCIPSAVYWRYPYFSYKSSDPISINRNGILELFAKGTNGQIYRMRQFGANGSWTGWTSLGGTAASDPVAVMSRTGGNAVFARFTDGNLYYCYQNGPTGTWSSWTNLGGPIVGKPAVGKSPDGRMDVFCRMADGSIQHRWEDYSSGWQAWASLGGNIGGDPVVALNWEGREEVFVRGTDNQLYHKWQMNDGTWSGWGNLGGQIVGEPSIGKSSDGRLEVFCHFADGSIQHNWQNGAVVGTSWSGWSAYTGIANSNIAAVRTPAFIQEIYYRDSNGSIYRSYQTAVDGGWSAWESIGGSANGTPIIGHNDDGRLQIFEIHPDGKIWNRYQLSGGGWSNWTAYGSPIFPENVPPVIQATAANPTLAAAGDSVSISATVTDNEAVASVTANGTALTNSGGNVWSGSIPADSALGAHSVAIQAVDTSGNTANATGSYTTARVVALTNRAASDSLMNTACANFLVAIYGKVSVVNNGEFTVDDGSGNAVDVFADNHGLTNGQFVRARGVLRSNGSSIHLDSAAGWINTLN